MQACTQNNRLTSILYISVFLNKTPWNLKFTLSWTSWPYSSVVIWRPARKPKTPRPFPIAVYQQQLPCWFSLISIEDEKNLVSSLFTQLVSMIFFFLQLKLHYFLLWVSSSNLSLAQQSSSLRLFHSEALSQFSTTASKVIWNLCACNN